MAGGVIGVILRIELERLILIVRIDNNRIAVRIVSRQRYCGTIRQRIVAGGLRLQNIRPACCRVGRVKRLRNLRFRRVICVYNYTGIGGICQIKGLGPGNLTIGILCYDIHRIGLRLHDIWPAQRRVIRVIGFIRSRSVVLYHVVIFDHHGLPRDIRGLAVSADILAAAGQGGVIGRVGAGDLLVCNQLGGIDAVHQGDRGLAGVLQGDGQLLNLRILVNLLHGVGDVDGQVG